MFGLGPATKIYIALESVDMRKGFDGLYGLVRDRLGEDPMSGHLFLFTNRGRSRLKALVWDGSGLWVCAKRLEKGRFRWPTGQDGRCIILHFSESSFASATSRGNSSGAPIDFSGQISPNHLTYGG